MKSKSPVLMKFIFLVIFTFKAFSLMAQENTLSHLITAEEERRMPGYREHQKLLDQRGIPMPPVSEVRTMAEWEEIQAVIITWSGQATILKEIVRNTVKECKIIIITDDSTAVSNSLTNSGIGLDSVRFVNTSFNSIWVCDYGPWTVYGDDVDSLWLIDWIYNRPRPEDDVTPQAIADYLHIPLYEATVEPDDFVHTGGNHFSDGLRNAFSSMLVLEENNDKSETEIDSIAYKYLGVQQYVKFPTLPFDGIHHLDMHMRIIDEETIIVGEYPEDVADGPQINANLEYLQNEVKTSFGNSYKIVRMPMPPDANGRYPDHGGNYRTYTNAVFINKTLLVPTYEEKYDTTALRIYRENLPGYNVVGINCNSIISSLGALHCITKLVGVNDPLLIAHSRLRDSEDPESEYPVSAYIRHSSGIAEANLYYRLSGDSVYTKLVMNLLDGVQNIWTAVIPPQVSGSEVQYYIEAKANNGKQQVRPIVAPSGYFRFRIHGTLINQPPTVKITYPQDGSIFSIDQNSIAIETDATDPDGIIAKVIVYINNDSIGVLDTVPFIFNWTFPNEGEFEITVRAEDNQGAQVWSAPVKIHIEGTTGYENESELSGIEIFPNPVEDWLWLKDLSDHNEMVSIQITNLTGQSMPIPFFDQGPVKAMDFSSLPSGTFILRAKYNDHVSSKLVVKK